MRGSARNVFIQPGFRGRVDLPVAAAGYEKSKKKNKEKGESEKGLHKAHLPC